MVQIFGNWGRIRTWINKRIRIKAVGNTFVGEDAGKVTTSDNNNFMGYQAGYSNTSGYRNNFMGSHAGHSNTSGYINNFMGSHAGHYNTIGHSNNFVGYQAGYSNTSGIRNNFMGYAAGFYNTTGVNNCFIGNNAGFSNITAQNNTHIGSKAGYSGATAWRNICLGYEAGYYELNGDRLIVDNDKRADTAAEQANALLYGLFAAAGAADQRLSINARVLIRTVPTYVDDAAAGTGGLVAGEVYKHADGSIHIKL